MSRPVRIPPTLPARSLAALALIVITATAPPALVEAQTPDASTPGQIVITPVTPPAATERMAPRTAVKPPRPRNAAYTRGLYTVEKLGRGIYYRRGYVLGVGINVVEADLSDPRVRVAALVARRGVGSAEGFGHMVARVRPAAAITGTFFGVGNLIPTGDLVVSGRTVFRGYIGTALAVTAANEAVFVQTRRGDQSVDWSRYETVIRGGPRLVRDGAATMNARAEGFRTLPVYQRRTRTAVGLTRDNRLQFVAVRQGVTMRELSKLMKAIGAYNAIALDGGTSTALYFAGRYIARPGRGLTNLLLLYHRQDRYAAMRPRLSQR
jgi:hypothetical protein